MGSGNRGARAEGGKGQGLSRGRDQARRWWRGQRRGGRGGRARDTPSGSPGGAASASASAALEKAAAGRATCRASRPRWTRDIFHPGGDPQLILSAPASRWSPRDPRAGRELRRRPQHHEAVVGRAAAWRPAALRTR